jgi:hypothetical protein
MVYEQAGWIKSQKLDSPLWCAGPASSLEGAFHPQEDALRSQPLSGTDWRFHGGCGWLAGSAVATSLAIPALKLAVSSLRSRHWPCPRRLQASAGVNVPDAILVGRFSGDNHWPVLGDRRGSSGGLLAALSFAHLARCAAAISGGTGLFCHNFTFSLHPLRCLQSARRTMLPRRGSASFR